MGFPTAHIYSREDGPPLLLAPTPEDLPPIPVVAAGGAVIRGRQGHTVEVRGSLARLCKDTRVKRSLCAWPWAPDAGPRAS